MTQRLVIEGLLPSTNQALDLRGAEAIYLRASRGRRPTGECFSTWAREVRRSVALLARARFKPIAAGALACVWVYLLGHVRYDPDGWTLPGKWIVDGLVDAKIFPSDRRSVYAVGGRVFGTAEEGRAFVGARDGLSWSGRPAALVEVTEGRA